jgi:hypothetical protein
MSAPKIASLLPFYPAHNSPEEVAELVGGDIGKSIKEDNWETCCIRLSRALNYGGSPVQGFGNIANTFIGIPGAHVRAQRGADKKWYIYSTYDLRAYLSVKFGQPKRFPGSATQADVKGMPGIIMFGWRHVDLWDGNSVARLDLFAAGSVLTDGLYLWPEGK